MGCTGWSIRDLGKEAGHEKENTLAAGNFPPFPDSGDSVLLFSICIILYHCLYGDFETVLQNC